MRDIVILLIGMQLGVVFAWLCALMWSLRKNPKEGGDW